MDQVSVPWPHCFLESWAGRGRRSWNPVSIQLTWVLRLSVPMREGAEREAPPYPLLQPVGSEIWTRWGRSHERITKALSFSLGFSEEIETKSLGLLVASWMEKSFAGFVEW